jgi:hypothetical protein
MHYVLCSASLGPRALLYGLRTGIPIDVDNDYGRIFNTFYMANV